MNTMATDQGSRGAIPTRYKGTLFRSRLEARYAAFFDVLKWKWDYEPRDLAGYIPDFILEFDRGQLLFEVKPADTLVGLREAAPKILRSGWRGDFVIAGSRILDSGEPWPVIGVMGQADKGPDGETMGHVLSTARLCRCLKCHRTSMYHEAGAWVCAQCGIGNGNWWCSPLEEDEAILWWAAAANAVQWKGAGAIP